jgi:heme exporter protein C
MAFTLAPYASLMHFYALSRRLTPWCAGAALVLFVAGLIGGLVLAPPDYQQGDSFRIMYVHVPSAWMSLFVYVVMAACGAAALIWKLKLAEIASRACAPLGASFTFLALVTGAIWGKPMWGTWWVWDARLTSELILLFLYLGVMALHAALEDRRVGARAGAVLALIGVVNVPIIHYSVEWWSTLHQGPTVSRLAAPAIHIDMLVPLLLMLGAFMAYFATVLLMRVRCEILYYDRNSTWVRDLVAPAA